MYTFFCLKEQYYIKIQNIQYENSFLNGFNEKLFIDCEVYVIIVYYTLLIAM